MAFVFIILANPVGPLLAKTITMLTKNKREISCLYQNMPACLDEEKYLE